MKALVLGGTHFIGRHVAETLLAAGHEVTVFNRGRSQDELPAAVERLRGDRDAGWAGLSALADRSWDACIDVSGYTPRQVRASAEALRDRVGRYVFLSAVSVYGDPRDRPVLETHPRLPPAGEEVTEVVHETYGALKVACEDLLAEIYGDRCTTLRPQVVAGPYDPSGRHTYWVWRAGRGGEMLAPGDGSDFVQVIDVRDLARFGVAVVEKGLGGAFNLAGPRITWAEFLRELGAEHLVWVPAARLKEAGLTSLELPLFRAEGSPRSGLMDVSNEKARAAGLTLTAPAATAAAVRDWLRGRELSPVFPPELEAELIRQARG